MISKSAPPSAVIAYHVWSDILKCLSTVQSSKLVGLFYWNVTKETFEFLLRALTRPVENATSNGMDICHTNLSWYKVVSIPHTFFVPFQDFHTVSQLGSELIWMCNQSINHWTKRPSSTVWVALARRMCVVIEFSETSGAASWTQKEPHAHTVSTHRQHAWPMRIWQRSRRQRWWCVEQ